MNSVLLSATKNSILKFLTVSSVSSANFLCTVVLSTSEKIAYMYTFKIMFDTSVIQ
jgi:hypothetical protein